MGPFSWNSNQNAPEIPPHSLYLKVGVSNINYDMSGYDLRKWAKELLNYLHVYTWDESCQGIFMPDYSYLISSDIGNSLVKGTDGKLFTNGSGSLGVIVSSSTGATFTSAITFTGPGVSVSGSTVTISGGTGGSGTVTSVGMTVPSAFSVTPSTITTSGIFAITGAGTTTDYVRGDGSLATFPTIPTVGITSLNSLTGAAQTLVTGNTGSSFNIVSTGTSHTFNLPTATSAVTGVLSSTDWTTFNNKQSAISLTTTGIGTATFISNVLNIPTPPSATFVSLTTTGNNGSATLIGGVLNVPTYTLAGLSGITLTSLSATSPLNYNNTTGVFTITQATTSANGYLSSTDWNTFNSKGSGTVTSVAALTLGTSGTDLSSSVATGTTTPVITLNVPTASATNRGALSSADWTTFNNKANTALSNLASVSINISLLAQTGVDLGSTLNPFKDLYLFGAGTYGTNYFKLTGTPTSTRIVTLPDLASYTLAQITNAQTFTGLQTFNNGVSVATGQTYQLGGLNLLYANPSTSTKTLILGLSAGNTSITGNDIVAVGYNAGNALTSATNTTLVGSEAGAFLTSGPFNTFIGYHAGYYSTSTIGQNTYIGSRAGEGNGVGAHNSNVGIGWQTMQSISSGTYNTVVGATSAGAMRVASNNVFIGYGVAQSNLITGTANDNVGIGYTSLPALTTGTFNTVVGRGAGVALSTGTFNTLLGAATGTAAGTSNSICLGSYATATADNQCVIGGYNAGNGIINNIFLGRGVSAVSANTGALTMQTTGISSGITDTSASQSVFNIAGARGTGTGAGGVINFQTAKAGSTGSAQNILVTQATVDMNFFGANHMKGISSTPSISAGTGAGTGATVNISGSDMAGWISVVAGTAPSTSATIATITFNVAYSTAPVCISLTPANISGATLSAASMVYVNRAGITTTTFAITSGTAGLTTLGTYEWYYSVLQ